LLRIHSLEYDFVEWREEVEVLITEYYLEECGVVAQGRVWRCSGGKSVEV